MINIYKNTLYVSGRQPQGERVAVPCQARGVATDLRDSCSVLRAVRPDGVVGGFADPSAPSSPWSLEGGFPRRPFLFSKQPFARTPSPPRDSHLPQRSHQSQARPRPFAAPSPSPPSPRPWSPLQQCAPSHVNTQFPSRPRLCPCAPPHGPRLRFSTCLGRRQPGGLTAR